MVLREFEVTYFFLFNFLLIHLSQSFVAFLFIIFLVV
jgi:hypothetical protein